jgi:hypothetical protein
LSKYSENAYIEDSNRKPAVRPAKQYTAGSPRKQKKMYQEQVNAVVSESQEQYSNTGIRHNRADKWMLLMAIMSDHHLPKDAVVVAAKILDHINCEAGHDYSFASYETIAGECNRSRSTVINAVNDLVKREWFRREKREHKTSLLHARFDRKDERLAPPAEKPKGTRKEAKTAPVVAPVQAAASPVVKSKQAPVVVTARTPAAISNDNTKPDFSDIQNIRTANVSIRYYQLKYPHIADDLHVLHAHLKEMDPDAGKIGNEHRRREWVLAELEKREKLARMLQVETKAA